MAFKAEIGTISATITADNSGLRLAMKQSEAALRKGDVALEKSRQHWDRWGSAVRNIVAGASVAVLTRQVVEFSNAATSITNKLRLATDSTQQLAQVTQQLLGIANESRASYEATVDLYAKLERSTRNLNLSQARLAKITSSVNKAFAISGATTQEAAGSIRQLGQALASGALRGDEFNSIAEQAPIIMEAVSKATGKTAGQLRELAAEGLITAEVLVESLERYADTIDTEFATASATFSQNMEVARNNAIAFVQASEPLNDAIAAAGEAIVVLSNNIQLFVDISKIAAAIMIGRMAPALVATTAGFVKQGIAALTASSRVDMYGAKVKAATVSTLAFNRVLTALGGPVGVLFTVVSSLVLFSDTAFNTDIQLNKLNETAKKTSSTFGTFGQKATELNDRLTKTEAITKITNDIKLTERALRRANRTAEATRKLFEEGRTEIGFVKQTEKDVAELTEKLRVLNEQLVTVGQRRETEDGLIQLGGTQEDQDQIDFENEMARQSEELRRAREHEARKLEERKRWADETLKFLSERAASEAELERMRFEEEMARLQEAFAIKGEITAEQQAQVEELKRQHEERLSEIQKKESEKRQEQDRKEALARIRSFEMFGQATLAAAEIFGSKSKKQQKRLRKAEVAISTGAAIARAFAENDFFTALGISAILVRNAKRQIDNINSETVGGSVTGGGSAPSSSAPQAQQTQNAPDRVAEIRVTGLSAGLLSAEQVRELIGQINEQVGDGFNIDTGG